MSFLYPFILIGLIPLLLLYKKRDKQKNSALDLQETKFQNRQKLFLYFSLAFILIAMARPVIKDSMSDERFDATDIIIAVDASFSMQADDIKPTRFEAAKEAIKELLRLHPKDRFTLFAFTSNALLISPPTTDSAISINALDALNPSFILTKSTNMKELFKTVAKSSKEKKTLILFTDGGDEHDVENMLSICKKNALTLYIVAVASKNGTTLKKDGHFIKDPYNSLVISRINPILKELANATGGRYYEFNSLNSIQEFSDDLHADLKRSQQAQVKVQSYTELFFVPLFIAALLFLAAVTKLHMIYAVLFLFFTPEISKADILDFYHINKAKELYKEQKYKDAANEFKKVSPSVQSYYDIAVAFYKAGHYKDAMNYFSQIQTPDAKTKQHIFYNMAGCAVHLKRFDRAQKLYEQSLALGEDADALYNLRLLQKLLLKTDTNIIDMLPPKNSQSQQSSSKPKSDPAKNEKKEAGKKSSSNRQDAQSSSGAGDSKKGDKQNQPSQKEKENTKNSYKMGYRAYELINKGYTNEKEPW